MKTILKISAVIAILGILFVIPSAPSAHAYGGRNQQWQITFSANCDVPTFPVCGGFTFGDWGWCELGGTDPSAQTGNSGDCQVTGYGRAGPGMPENPAHNSISVTGWHIGVAPGAPYAVFILDSGTITCTGPGATTGGCFSSLGFPQATGVPGAPGHYNTLSLLGIPAVPGVHFNAQVTLLK